MRNLIKRILGIEKVNKIKIPKEFIEHPPKLNKLHKRENYYVSTGKFFVPIVVNRNNELVDGYTSFFIAKLWSKKYVKVTRV